MPESPMDPGRRKSDVDRLRELRAGAVEPDRERAGQMLGVALADLTVTLGDDHPDLAALVAEGLSLLADAGDLAYLERARQTLTGRLAVVRSPTGPVAGPPAGPLPRSTVPGSPAAGVRPARAEHPSVVAARSMAGAPITPSGFSLSAGPGDLQQFRQMVEQARGMLSAMPAGHPMGAQLRLVVGFGDGMEALASGKWTPVQEKFLADLRQDAAAAASVMDPQLASMIPALMVMMRSARAHTLQASPIESDHVGPAELDELVADLEEASDRVGTMPIEGAQEMPRMLRFMAAYFLILRSGFDPDQGAGPAGGAPAAGPGETELLRRARRYLRDAPPEFAAQARTLLASLDVYESLDDPGADSPDLERSRQEFTKGAEEYADLAPVGLLAVAMQRAEQVRITRRPEELDAMIQQLRDLRHRLPAGHPQHADLLSVLANLLGLRASLTQSAPDSAESILAGMQAIRAQMTAASQASVEVAGHLVGALSAAAVLDLREGPFREAETVLSEALSTLSSGSGGEDARLRATLNTGIGCARMLLWRTDHDPQVHQAARQALDEAQRLLPTPEATDRWLGPAISLLSVNLGAAVFGADPQAVAATTTLIDQIEGLLDRDPDLSSRMIAGMLPGGLAGMGLRPDAAGLRQSLAMMRSSLQLLSATGPLGGAAQAFARPDVNRRHVEDVVNRIRDGGGLGFDPAALLNDPQAMTQAAARMMADNPDLMKTMFEQLGAPAARSPAPPPAPSPAPRPARTGSPRPAPTTGAPTAADSRLLVERGLARAGHVLCADGQTSPARPALSRLERPDLSPLRAAVDDLRAGLEGGLDDGELVPRARGRLGICLAELHWAGETDPVAVTRAGQGGSGGAATLRAAVRELDAALSLSSHALPTVERADLLAIQARCSRELGRTGISSAGLDAERLARAALAELRRCVLLLDDPEQARPITDRATDIVGRAVGWCLADERLAAAVEIAEAGRSLVLASLVLAGRVENLLRAGAGGGAVAKAWHSGTVEGRLAGLQAVSASMEGQMLLTTPPAQEISRVLYSSAAAFDAIVYLVPAAPERDGVDETAGRALLVRPGFEIESLPLPGAVTGPGTPIADYVARFAGAVGAVGAVGAGSTASGQPRGFLGTSEGPGWAAALDELGAWAHREIVGPLVRHVSGWDLPHEAHLSLVPLGELGAVPYAAAWRPDDSLPGGRRYAVHDLVLSYIASSRLLIDVAGRSRRGLLEDVVVVSDATGDFHFSRRAATTVYEGYGPAERRRLYGRRENDRRAPDGAATTDRILTSMLGDDKHPPASLLHLATHGTTRPEPRLQTTDGWLTLSRILDLGWRRPQDAGGGLLITTACLTDTTDGSLDEALTLATALLASFATGVIGTRWPIDDEVNAVFLVHLHDRLRAGSGPAHALREAQLAMLSEPGANPSGWAGYVHHGC